MLNPMTDRIPRLNAALEGRYRLEKQVGEGVMATVYLSDDVKHVRKVALKVLKPELAAVAGAERFLSEIKTTASLTWEGHRGGDSICHEATAIRPAPRGFYHSKGA